MLLTLSTLLALLALGIGWGRLGSVGIGWEHMGNVLGTYWERVPSRVSEILRKFFGG